jgi:hypothetical protein
VRNILVLVACLTLAACFHIPFFSKKQPAAGKVIGVVEYDTGLTKFSTVTGVYHQDMCSKADSDAKVHLSDREMKAILAAADKKGFYKAPADLRYWTETGQQPPRCATFRLRIESGAQHNEVRWDCGCDGSNAPPAEVASVVEEVRKALWSKPEVQSMPWSSCQVR